MTDTTLRIPLVLTLTPAALDRAKATMAEVVQHGAKRLGRPIKLEPWQQDLLLRVFLASTAAEMIDPMCSSVIAAVIAGTAVQPSDGQTYAVRLDPDDLPGMSMILPLPAFNTAPQDLVDALRLASESDVRASKH